MLAPFPRSVWSGPGQRGACGPWGTEGREAPGPGIAPSAPPRPSVRPLPPAELTASAPLCWPLRVWAFKVRVRFHAFLQPGRPQARPCTHGNSGSPEPLWVPTVAPGAPRHQAPETRKMLVGNHSNPVVPAPAVPSPRHGPCPDTSRCYSRHAQTFLWLEGGKSSRESYWAFLFSVPGCVTFIRLDRPEQRSAGSPAGWTRRRAGRKAKLTLGS